MPYKNPKVQREYQRKWVAERRAYWFRDKVCANCGTKEHLELDHIDPDKKWKHRIWSYSWAKIIAETAKCQVLCFYCHLDKTIKERELEQVHGTEYSYEHYKCRCPECRGVHNENVNEWRHRTGRRGQSKRLLAELA